MVRAVKGGCVGYCRGKDGTKGTCREQRRKAKAPHGARAFCYSTDKVYDPKLITCSETSFCSVFQESRYSGYFDGDEGGVFSGVGFNDIKFASNFSNSSAWLCTRMSASSHFSCAVMLNDKLSSAEKNCCKIRLAMKDLVFTWGRKLSVAGKLAALEEKKTVLLGTTPGDRK